MRKHLIWLFVAISANLPMFNYVVSGQSTYGADRPISLASASKANEAQVTSEIREFEVRVDNKPMGTHSLTIKVDPSDKAKHEVVLQTDVKADYFVYAYIFKSRGTEVWRDGRVESCDIKCEDGGKKRSISLKTKGTTQQIAFNGKPVATSSPGVMTTAYWQLPSTDLRSKQMTIVDVDSGAIKNATLNLVGDATVTCDGRSLACQHFKIDGPSPAELWFDDQNRLVRQKSIEQGHAMELRLKLIRISKDDR